jgi:hypothetical protein
MKKTLSVIAVTAFAAAASVASAQWGRQYDPAWPDRNPDWRGGQECWNPRAGHFEAVRPGEVQNDLDFGNCRGAPAYGNNYYVVPADRYVAPADRYVGRIYRDDQRYGYANSREECWNPRACHFEEVRRGEYQNDLDYRRCRIARY